LKRKSLLWFVCFCVFWIVIVLVLLCLFFEMCFFEKQNFKLWICENPNLSSIWAEFWLEQFNPKQKQSEKEPKNERNCIVNKTSHTKANEDVDTNRANKTSANKKINKYFLYFNGIHVLMCMTKTLNYNTKPIETSYNSSFCFIFNRLKLGFCFFFVAVCC
jgi:hypothetical protein